MIRNSAKIVGASVMTLAMLGTPATGSAQSHRSVASYCNTDARARPAANRSRARYQRSGVQYEEAARERSKTKSALIIAGSAATGAGVGGVLNGAKGALIGAAIGGGAASIYEGAKRR